MPEWREGEGSLLLEVEVTGAVGNACLRRRCPSKAKLTRKSCRWTRQLTTVRKSKEIEEVTAVKAARSTEMEGGLVRREHIGEVGEEHRPLRIKAPPQKTRVVIRVESAKTQDYVTGQHPEKKWRSSTSSRAQSVSRSGRWL